MNDPLSYNVYLDDLFKRDPHGLSQESREVEEATRSVFDAFWTWNDGSPVGCVLYLNYGAAIKVARRYNFLLPEETVTAHAKIKASREDGTRAFSHEVSFRHPVPHDDHRDTIMRVTR